MSTNKKYAGNPDDKNKSSNPNSATPYKRKYGLELLLSKVDPDFMEEGELEAATRDHERLSQLFQGVSVREDVFQKEFITGTVVNKTAEGYYVTFGQKYDGFVPLAQGEGLAIGDTAEFYVIEGAGKNGHPTLSYRAAKGWRKLEESQDKDTVLTALVFAEAKKRRTQKSAGWRVEFQEGDLKGIRGFVPNAEIGRALWGVDLIGKTIEVSVCTAQPQGGGEFGNLVLSNKKPQAVADEAAIELMEPDTIVVGQIIRFIKASPSDLKFSALIKLPNDLVGMLHRSETVSFQDDLQAMYKVGDEITVAVRSVDLEKKRISLSLKQAAIINCLASIEPGKRVEATILRQVNFGYFAGIAGGAMEGLIHQSDLATVNGRKESFKLGDKVMVEIISYNPDGSRLALGRKFATAVSAGGVVDIS